MSDKLERMKESLVSMIELEMHNLGEADTKELGEAIDMVKDLSEAIYYCTVTKAMEHSEEKESHQMYYTPMPDRMYYDGDGRTSNGNNHSNGRGSNPTSYYTEREMPIDKWEGRSPRSRKMYMEGKEMHMDKASQMRELEKYMQELTQDVVEMVEDASPEEKQYLSKKISMLANKIGQLSD
jgi:hypothetical protein